ncbi:uncharacterized protein CEXT_501321 [Caerostris extrusa]|uniref:Uncharacterized protein n=1 Tax=Caerostris extrusa TaxID=172846 RepID=A0AAV4RVH2_CAEEX|nr:uncharacterized protein CEXT_501321 [Caerostris extrusa]
MEFKSKRVLEKIKSKQNINDSSNFGDNSHLAVCENPYKNTSPRLPELELYKFGEIDTEYLEFDEREKITKREILSLVSPVFDPIGFLAPVMIQPKILLQATWKAKESWDEELNNEIKINFLKWRKTIEILQEYKNSQMSHRDSLKLTHPSSPWWEEGIKKAARKSTGKYPEKDGIIRLVKLRTEKGNIKTNPTTVFFGTDTKL